LGLLEGPVDPLLANDSQPRIFDNAVYDTCNVAFCGIRLNDRQRPLDTHLSPSEAWILPIVAAGYNGALGTQQGAQCRALKKQAVDHSTLPGRSD
jgi:hypothetical protein